MVRTIVIRTRSDDDAADLVMDVGGTDSIQSRLAKGWWETDFGSTIRLLVVGSVLEKAERRIGRTFELDCAGIADAGAQITESSEPH